jgi:hypothetical protein
MSNDKSAATWHGVTPEQIAEYAAKDALTPNQRGFAERLGQLDITKPLPSPSPEEAALMVQQFEEDYPAFAAWRRISGYPQPGTETTGEHIQHKLADDLYQDFVSPKDDPGHHHALPELTDAQVDRLYEAISHRGPKRDWTPTPGEIGLAMGIIVFIIVLFLFIVFAYPGW